MKLFGRQHSLPIVAVALACTAGCWLSCSGSSDSTPRLGKMAVRLPEKQSDASSTTAPKLEPSAEAGTDDRSPEAEPAANGAKVFAGSVDEAVTQGCTTKIVEELSRQILEEAGCMSSAAFVPVPQLPTVQLDDAVLPYLSRAARDALVRVSKEFPKDTLRITSMTRTVAQQFILYRWYRTGRCGVTLAAKPGTSNHEGGLALDVGSPMQWRKRLSRFGFRWLGKRDRWHFDFVDKNTKRHKRIGVQAFQRLWNRNNTHDTVREDGTFDSATERALRQAPAAGFAIGPSCEGPQPTAP